MVERWQRRIYERVDKTEGAGKEMSEEELQEQIIQQIEVLVEELGGKMVKSTRHDYTGRSSKIITIEYDITQS